MDSQNTFDPKNISITNRKHLQIKLLGTWHYSRQYQVWIIFIKGHLCYRFCLYLGYVETGHCEPLLFWLWWPRSPSLVTLALVDWMVDVGMCRLVKPACCHSDAGTPLHVCLLYCSAFHWQAQGQVWVGYRYYQGQYQTIYFNVIVRRRRTHRSSCCACVS